MRTRLLVPAPIRPIKDAPRKSFCTFAKEQVKTWVKTFPATTVWSIVVGGLSPMINDGVKNTTQYWLSYAGLMLASGLASTFTNAEVENKCPRPPQENDDEDEYTAEEINSAAAERHKNIICNLLVDVTYIANNDFLVYSYLHYFEPNSNRNIVWSEAQIALGIPLSIYPIALALLAEKLGEKCKLWKFTSSLRSAVTETAGVYTFLVISAIAAKHVNASLPSTEKDFHSPDVLFWQATKYLLVCFASSLTPMLIDTLFYLKERLLQTSSSTSAPTPQLSSIRTLQSTDAARVSDRLSIQALTRAPNNFETRLPANAHSINSPSPYSYRRLENT